MLPKKEKRERVPFETGEEKQKINVRHQEDLFEKIDSEQDEKVDRVDAEVVMERSRADILIEKSNVIENSNSNSLNTLTLEEHYNFYKKQGLSKNEIIKKIAKDKKVNKNEIYKNFI